MSTSEPSAPVPPTPAPPSSGSRWLLALVLLAAVGTFYALGLQRYVSWDYIRTNLDRITAHVDEHPLLDGLVFALVYTLVTALSLPAASALTLLAGALFGGWLGTGLVSIASTSGATLAFLSSRYLFRDLVQRRFGDRLAPLNKGVEREGAYYLFTLRLVPVFPFFLVNLAMGLTPMRVATYAWVSWLGMLPATVLYVNAGRELRQINSPGDILSPSVLVSFALLGVLPLLFRKLIDWKRRPG